MIEQRNIIKKNVWYFDILFTAVHKQVGGGVPGADINSEVKKLNKLSIDQQWTINEIKLYTCMFILLFIVTCLQFSLVFRLKSGDNTKMFTNQ